MLFDVSAGSLKIHCNRSEAPKSSSSAQWTHHHVTAREAIRPITELAAVEGAELHRSELQHLKVKLET